MAFYLLQITTFDFDISVNLVGIYFKFEQLLPWALNLRKKIGILLVFLVKI